MLASELNFDLPYHQFVQQKFINRFKTSEVLEYAVGFLPKEYESAFTKETYKRYSSISDPYESTVFLHEYSCCAVEYALACIHGIHPYTADQLDGFKKEVNRIYKGLRNMGVKTGSASVYDSFINKHGIRKTQEARALWLTWAAMMAKEQND